ncbi:family 20 glycosylhydrolase [Mucilaginibacter phyllosphaerae]|uniref:beta-N-acetylhexosaminidase n=1 Tax=Mucilaginibacter phyllosphaerae TaxID=1812349 RepID=A0A4Y8AGN4_9SPHI|nr:family 20 glycosylhydrolase [Mucilaginibacter phyllosphaerae]MBB3968879.1 hexosaminidase [Mucilaginibacter phyllosphaerae]TEW67492.1 beta-N-acetylhexosaminidase [Mucilaginibacter phyllosphaerae]GGH13357.1 beta-N-acetylhexosaminidase [Mucilaginibacter phyllosphaerae]
MRRFFTLIFFIVITFKTVIVTAGAPAFNVKDLHLSWEVVDNNYQNKPRALTALIITNKGNQTLPASGWKIYFNSSRDYTSDAVSGNAKIAQINGDLYCITPNDKFAAIKPGEHTRIEYVCDAPVVNFTDAIEGPYFVWDAVPDKGYLPGDFTIKPYSPTYQGLITPEILYNQNKVIQDIPASQLQKIIPTPVSYIENSGNFIITNTVNIVSDPLFAKEKAYFIAGLEKLLGSKLKNISAGKRITFKKDTGLGAEAYTLTVTPTSINVGASTTAGLFYGIQSLQTAIAPSPGMKAQANIPVPCMEVKDEPRFSYRAVMLDVARNFQSKQQVVKLLNLMGVYKLNTLHLHLTDDEGWRIEIPSLPELTAVGSKRGHTLDSKALLPASHGSGPDISNIAGTGFYTKADYIEILKYATERHITVIPEIETPGHARASIKAMTARYNRLMAAGDKAGAERNLLVDLNDKSAYHSVQYWNDNVIDVSLPSTYNYIETVVGDLVNIYKEAGAPLPLIHFGGDEVPAHVWEKSPAYLALKASNPEIQNTGDLWYYFYGRVNSILKKRNIRMAGWEEMALRKTLVDGQSTYVPNPQFAGENMQVDVWNNVLGDGQEDLAYKLANGGYKTVLTCVTNLYFDMANYKSFDEPGYYWGAFLGIDKFFSFIPYDYFKNADVDKNGRPINRNIFIGKQRLTDYGKTNIIGLQGALWGETVKTPERMDYMIFPKLIGLGERAWAKDPAWATERDTAKARELYNADWSKFLNILGKRELPRLAYYNGGYNFRIPKPGVILEDGKYKSNIQFPGMVIRYTTNGKEPDANSTIYEKPIPANGMIKFRAFDVKGRGGNVAEVQNKQEPAM